MSFKPASDERLLELGGRLPSVTKLPICSE
jgi:hypothetical protein